MKAILTILLMAVLAGRVAAIAGAAPQPLAAFFAEHCVDCHDADVTKGGLNLETLEYDLHDEAAFQKWQRIFERVRDHEMPPPKRRQPPQDGVSRFTADLQSRLTKADAEDIAQNGRVRGRRLTRAEYEFTVQDLLGIDIPLKELLPADRLSHGFETVADGQQLSQHLLARYLDVADLALNEAFRRALKGDEVFEKFSTPEDLARFTRGNYRGPDLKNGESRTWPMTLQFFGRVKSTEVPEDGWYRITVKSVRAINPPDGGVVWGTLRSGTCYSDAPMLYMIGLVEATETPRDMVYEAWIQKGHMLELKPNDARLKKAATGANGGNVSFEGRDLEKDGYAGIANMGIKVERIYPVANRQSVQQSLFGEQNVGKKNNPNAPMILDRLVKRFAANAFRRPVSDEQAAAYAAIGRQALRDGETLVEALKSSYRAILCSPRFLTFVEAPGPLDDYAIASRLSYAFWLSKPDKRLLSLAEQGKLHEPEVVAQQARRLLSDPKADRFVKSYADQWLKLREIDFTSPDTKQFPTFDAVVQESMLQETRQYLAYLIEKDLGVDHLVDSDFAFLNQRLAQHYGVDADLVPGEGLQRVVLKPGPAQVRGGLLTQGAVLKVTADGTTTSPVVRGLFINERILGQHVPPPPPGVPAIEPDIRGATSIRDQLDKHRSNETCASCHRTIDPPGFALENYDPVGGWRLRYGKAGKKGAAVNAAGVTPEGEQFADLMQWKRLYTRKREQLARAFVEQFLTYATGAPIRFSDRTAVDEVVKKAGTSACGLRSLITAAAASPVFLEK